MDPNVLFNVDDTTNEYEHQFGLIRPGIVPTTPIVWPIQRSSQTKIQQGKSNATPLSASTLATVGPAQSPVAPRTTPQPVSKVRVIKRPVPSGYQITVQFTHPFGDQHFQGASVYLRRSGTQPAQVSSGAKSPLTFTVAKNSAPHSIYVTSFGPFGETNVLTSPSHPVHIG
jgi:hypothetical protein